MIIYTDGSCRGNPGPGGWAWASSKYNYANGGEMNTTNQRMELRAVIQALNSFTELGAIEIVSDSKYVVDCFHREWWRGWLRRGWVNSQRKPVANRDLWEELIDLYMLQRPTFTWVKGHSGHWGNNLVDRLAGEAMRRMAGG